ncbi:right-handed parallel beta-helix repeat-containing protein [Enhygromyxa salina]|uniref:right-handed parallel beta-helix repeat-containing protein n=1 Tax=Enhygromyxa salina TaxID=215803 RepID=UPI000D031C69|nr:hypothetical protein [Enhygromyxa salina]
MNGTSDANCAADGEGTDAAPYCTLSQALTAVDSNSLIVLHEMLTGPQVYNESNSVQLDVAILAAPGETPVVEGTGGNAALTVANAGNLYMRGVTISGTQNGGEGIVIAGGGAWIEGSHVVNNSGGGIVVDGGGSLFLENSFVGGSADSPAVRVPNGTFDLLYVTMGLPAVLGGPALECSDGTMSTVRNSLITSTHSDPELDCPNVSISASALEALVGDNVALGDVEVGWFDGYLSGDFHLSGSQPAATDTAAIWQSGDPSTDIDGDPRPTQDGPDFAGADVLP